MAQWVNDPARLCEVAGLIPSQVQWAKDLAELELWHRPRMWLGFSPWPRNFHMPWVQPKKAHTYSESIYRFLWKYKILQCLWGQLFYKKLNTYCSSCFLPRCLAALLSVLSHWSLKHGRGTCLLSQRCWVDEMGRKPGLPVKSRWWSVLSLRLNLLFSRYRF